MQVAAGSGETSSEPAPAVVTPTSRQRFYSVEAAAKHWAAPMGIVMRPGGYLHTLTPELYTALPEWLQGPKNGMSEVVYRLYDYLGRVSVCGWGHLGAILLGEDLMYVKTGPRGATQFYLREQS